MFATAAMLTAAAEQHGHGHCHSPPSTLTKRDGGRGRAGSGLMPLDSWHAPRVRSSPSSGGVALLHAGRARRREMLLASGGRPLLASVPIEDKGGVAMQQRKAVLTTIWSFVATAIFAFAVVLPYKGRQATLDFVTGFLVEKASQRAPASAHGPLGRR